MALSQGTSTREFTYLTHLRGSPQGCKIVAGGRRPPETMQLIVGTLKGCETNNLAPLQGATRHHSVPVVYAALRPPATFSQPCGL